LALSYAELATGLAGQLPPDPARVRRLVFVCHGNICRSAYAHVLARRAGARVASFGLSTATGKLRPRTGCRHGRKARRQHDRASRHRHR
jgi:protein-tyrosine phosphatase